jgi:ABC-type iron transport system FetAB ATPase subunit
MKLEEEFPVDYDNCYTSIALDENMSLNFLTKIKILNNISLTVNQGERIFLEGPNGSGKNNFIRFFIQPISISDNSLN